MLVNNMFVQFCWDLGGSLAEFNDKEEESHVSSFLNAEDYYWIGLNDLSQEGCRNSMLISFKF